MSASERLKALENFGPPENYDDMHRLQRAFPQIVAVVEAAEKARAADWQPHGKSYWEIEQLLNEIRDSADAALEALNEKLNGAEHSPSAEAA